MPLTAYGVHGICVGESLAGGDKADSSEKRFYTRLIAKADQRFDTHLQRTAPKRK